MAVAAVGASVQVDIQCCVPFERFRCQSDDPIGLGPGTCGREVVLRVRSGGDCDSGAPFHRTVDLYMATPALTLACAAAARPNSDGPDSLVAGYAR